MNKSNGQQWASRTSHPLTLKIISRRERGPFCVPPPSRECRFSRPVCPTESDLVMRLVYTDRVGLEGWMGRSKRAPKRVTTTGQQGFSFCTESAPETAPQPLGDDRFKDDDPSQIFLGERGGGVERSRGRDPTAQGRRDAAGVQGGHLDARGGGHPGQHVHPSSETAAVAPLLAQHAALFATPPPTLPIVCRLQQWATAGRVGGAGY